MIRNKDGMKIFYDREADVLYVTRGQPEYTDYVEYTDDVILRFDPGAKKLVGFTIIDFSQHFAQQKPDVTLPFSVDFQMDEEVNSLH
jgi:uncharacterized protein YuzE